MIIIRLDKSNDADGPSYYDYDYGAQEENSGDTNNIEEYTEEAYNQDTEQEYSTEYDDYGEKQNKGKEINEDEREYEDEYQEVENKENDLNNGNDLVKVEKEEVNTDKDQLKVEAENRNNIADINPSEDLENSPVEEGEEDYEDTSENNREYENENDQNEYDTGYEDDDYEKIKEEQTTQVSEVHSNKVKPVEITEEDEDYDNETYDNENEDTETDESEYREETKNEVHSNEIKPVEITKENEEEDYDNEIYDNENEVTETDESENKVETKNEIQNYDYDKEDDNDLPAINKNTSLEDIESSGYEQERDKSSSQDEYEDHENYDDYDENREKEKELGIEEDNYEKSDSETEVHVAKETKDSDLYESSGDVDSSSDLDSDYYEEYEEESDSVDQDGEPNMNRQDVYTEKDGDEIDIDEGKEDIDYDENREPIKEIDLNEDIEDSSSWVEGSGYKVTDDEDELESSGMTSAPAVPYQTTMKIIVTSPTTMKTPVHESLENTFDDEDLYFESSGAEEEGSGIVLKEIGSTGSSFRQNFFLLYEVDIMSLDATCMENFQSAPAIKNAKIAGKFLLHFYT